jgi:hypothetical protein
MSHRRKKLTDLLDPAFMNRLDAMDVLSRKILQGKLQGERRSKRRGQSVEFADHECRRAVERAIYQEANRRSRLR